MTRIGWDNVGERIYTAGCDRGVLYPKVGPGVAWNGLVSVAESSSGGEVLPFYLDGQKYLNVALLEDFAATLNAYTYPDEFEEMDGNVELITGLFATAQPRKSFGLSYRTKVGSDTDALGFGYKIHLVYNILASPSAKANASVGQTVAPTIFSWALSTVPPRLEGRKRTAHFIIDSRTTYPYILGLIEDILYGGDPGDPRLPDPAELLEIFATETPTMIVTDHGDGTFTIDAPSDILTFISGTEFQIDSDEPGLVIIDADSFEVTST